ncbi:MAG: hypothetical protein AAGB04_30745, partial [Pseudomonadota bacterium]
MSLPQWAPAFAGMPEAHLLVIGRLMAALSPLIESQETALTSGLDELDSFDDIASTGPLDRLMTSELMWLKLVRGEFARRIAEGEALRRRPVYRDPADDRAVAVLIDNGHRMLGRRRLIALAALLVLGSSALRRGDRFLWAATNHVGPAWQEGISRRALSRYINQTGVDGLDNKAVQALLRDAPTDLSEDRMISWTIAPKDTDLGDWSPRYRFEVDEHLPSELEVSDTGSAQYFADVAVISEHRVRRSARFPFPDEQTCADTLRAPFRKSNSPDAFVSGETWAPDWISREADDGSAIFRDGEGIAMYRRNLEPLRFDLQSTDALLGARWPGNGPGTIVFREGNELHAIRFNAQGHVFSRGSTPLAGDHPLIAGTHANSSVPPLLRIGRKASIAVGAPNGQLYAVTLLDEGAVHSGLAVALADQTKDLRLLSRSRSWLLCETDRGGNRTFVLVHARDGRRIFLRREDWLDNTRGFSGFEVIGETGGALINVDGGWRWLAPAWWPASEQTSTWPAADHAILIRVDPFLHARNAVLQSQSASHPMGQRRWQMLCWSRDNGIEEWTFTSGQWSRFQRRTPEFDGRVTAITLLGKDAYARVEDDNGAISLVAFRPGVSRSVDKVQVGPRWWGDAPCIDY